MDQQEFDLKLGDILRFHTDNVIVHGIFLELEFRQTVYRDTYGKSGYYIYKVIAFDSGKVETFYGSEYVANFTSRKKDEIPL